MTARPIGRDRRRWADRFIVAAQAVGLLLATLLLVWAADGVARIGAQSLVARNLAQATGVTEPPQVRLRGDPFLLQVIRGNYETVDVSVRGVTSGPLRIDHIEGRLDGVRLPFHDVLVRDVRAIGVVSSWQRVRLTYADLNYYFEQTGRPLTIGLGAADRLRLTGTVNVLGRALEASADVTVSPTDGALRVTPDTIETGEQVLDAATRLLLRQRLTLNVPLAGLPFGQRVTSVAADPESLVFETVGYGIVVGA